MPKLKANPVPGTTVVMSGERLLVPPMSLGALELFGDQLVTLRADPTNPEAVRTIIDVTLSALRRNYPDITREEVSELIDVGNMETVMLAVMATSGLQDKVEGEPSGEFKTGSTSTPSSLPVPDGPSTTVETTLISQG